MSTAATAWILASLLAPLAEPVSLAAFYGVFSLLLTREAGLTRFRLPENRRQVPRSVYDRGAAIASLQFGFELGTGVRTYVPSGAPHLLLVGLLLFLPPFGTAILVGVGFGLARGTVPVFWYLSQLGDAWGDRFQSIRRVVSLASMIIVTVGVTMTLPG